MELGFSSDFRHQHKYEKKQAHYEPLHRELQGVGWEVHEEVHVITVGARATVPEQNDRVVGNIGIYEKN